MNQGRPNTRLSRGRPMAIVLLLVLALVLMGLLGWQSWKLQQSHMDTADSVLREYAILAADEFGRRATAQLGYQGFYTLLSRTATLDSPGMMREELEANESLNGLTNLAQRFFVFRNQEIEAEGKELSEAARALITNATTSIRDSESPFHSQRSIDGTEQIVFGLRRSTQDEIEVAGFVVGNAGIGSQLQTAFNLGPLLPTSLAGGQVSNVMLFARVTDPAGNVLFEENPVFNSPLTIARTLGAEYQGILEGFKVEVSLDSYSADALVIGGLPRSRLPLLLLAMLLVVGLMVTAIWLFRREQAVMKLRSDFVSQVSHELRTPLTQIRMFAETLLMNRARSDAERQRSLEIINRESQRLSHLVENILQFSRNPDSQLDCRKQDLAPIISELCTIAQSTNQKVNILFEADEPSVAFADADAVRQVVLNLLDNAIKFGPEGQTIRVSVVDDDTSLQISVEDQGPGIPESERTHVFSPFYRLRREEKTAISGTGIGLSVVRELAEAMGGCCHIEDCEPGTRVCVDLNKEPPNA